MESRNRSNTQNDGIKQTENLYNVILENLEKTMLFVSETGLHHFSCHASKQRNCFTVKSQKLEIRVHYQSKLHI